MSFTTLPQSTLPENRPTRLVTHPSGYIQPGGQHRQLPHARRPSPYPVLPRHLPTDFGMRSSWVVEFDRERTDPYIGRHRRADHPVEPFRRPAPRTEAEYTARLQEIAWDRFLRKTADLAACHARQPKRPFIVRLTSACKRAVHRVTRTPRLASATL